jgi:hypothetical protein
VTDKKSQLKIKNSSVKKSKELTAEERKFITLAATILVDKTLRDYKEKNRTSEDR